ncbi:MAG: hypothetical protein RIR86_816 [Acidobacteriota bacterium]
MCLEVSFTRQGQVRWGRRWLKRKGDRPLAVDPLLLASYDLSERSAYQKDQLVKKINLSKRSTCQKDQLVRKI